MKHFLNELISAGNRRKNFFLLLVVLVSSAMLQAQNIAVSGIVKDVTGESFAWSKHYGERNYQRNDY